MNKLASGKAIVWLAFLFLPIMAESVEAQHKLFEVRPTVVVIRSGKRDSNARKYLRQPLSLNDRIEVRRNSGKAKVRCVGSRGKSATWSVPSDGKPYPISSGCKQNLAKGGNTRIGTLYDSIPGGNDATIPYLIEPRRTFVDSRDFNIRWNHVRGATEYSIRLVRTRDQTILWEQRTVDTQIRYSGKQRLQPGEDYLIIIESSNGTSSQLDEGAALSSFMVLSQEARREVDEQKRSIPGQDLSREGVLLFLADTYKQEGLFAKAAESLEVLVAENTAITFVYVDLADLYQSMGLNGLAETRYRQALESARQSEYREGLAASLAGLAEVSRKNGQRQQALTLLQEAKQIFEQLGDQERSAKLENQIQRMEEPGRP